MEKRPLGRSGLAHRPARLGGNVFGWTADEATSFAILDRFVDAGLQPRRHRQRLLDLGAGPQGRRVGDDHRQLAAKSGKRDRVLHRDQGRHGRCEGEKGLKRAQVEKHVEESLRAPADRPHRPLPDARGRSRHAGRGDARGARPAGEIGEGARDRRVAVRRRTACASRSRRASGWASPRYETLQPEFNLYDRAGFERDLQPVAVEHGLAVIPFFGLAKGFLSGKYRKASDIEGRPRAAGLKKYFEGDRGMRILGGARHGVEARRRPRPRRSRSPGSWRSRPSPRRS